MTKQSRHVQDVRKATLSAYEALIFASNMMLSQGKLVDSIRPFSIYPCMHEGTSCIVFLEVCHRRIPLVHPYAHGLDVARFGFENSTRKIASFNATDGS